MAGLGARDPESAPTNPATDRFTLFGPWRAAALVAFLLLVVPLSTLLKGQMPEPDDYLRLQQVRDLLAGQNWFDSRQYRMNPPFGADIHWVRLVDIPIAAFILVFRLFLDERLAETCALVAVPLFQFAVVIALLRALMRELGQTPQEVVLAVVLVPLMPLLLFSFMPLRIDHHGWQAISVLAMVWLMLRGSYRDALIGGVLAAALIWISVEGVPMVAIIAGIYALRYVSGKRREHEAFLLGLALAGPGLYLGLRPLSAIGESYCDMMSWPHFLAFALSASVVAASRFFPGQDDARLRFAALLPAPLLAAPALLVPLGVCAISPMAVLDPLLRDNWFHYLLESAPVWRQIPSAAGMMVGGVIVLLVGIKVVYRRFGATDMRGPWLELTLATLGAALIASLVLRAGVTLQLLLLPFSAAIVHLLLPRARALRAVLPRVLATVGCFVIATPAIPSAVFKLFDSYSSYTLVEHPLLGREGNCDIGLLNQLAPAMMFNSIDLGAEVVARTPHSVVMGGYHRNQAKMIEVIRAFSGPLDQAHAVIAVNNADYLVTCSASADLAAYANMGEGNLADRIFARDVPGWLVPVETGNPALRLYRVMPLAQQSPIPEAGNPAPRR
ncbi:MAG: hypothetical protein B7Y88_09650 [Sphingomonadales bacterium 32-64-17]|nr:MAG: hypothetical protein B7Y88_09650 [Sphingomonadales bacterium 32-64-17]